MLSLISTLIGGLGLLLIGMSLMTDGLKLAAGNTLRDMLARGTDTRVRGLFSGFMITGIVQASGAVTVATIGFANAGMLSLEKAVWVIYGSNVGTTMTAWIVALIGFQIDMEALALPLIGIGALLKLSGGDSRRASFGLALVGFGLLFLGIGVLKGSFESLGTSFTFPVLEQLGILNILLYAGLGFLLTSAMQSSSASIVIALSAAQGGLIEVNAAAAVVIGANLGTTTTALLSVFGATSTAKRVAMSHVGFNLITAIVALFLLSPMLWLGDLIQQLFNLQASPAMSLAIFHSVFNIVGVLLMWPISSHLVAYLSKRFTTMEDKIAQPQFLDKNVLTLPYLAIDSLSLEVKRVSAMSMDYILSIMDASREVETPGPIRELSKTIAAYAVELNGTSLTPFLAEVLGNLVEAMQEFLFALDLSDEIRDLQDVQKQTGLNTEIRTEALKFTNAVQDFLSRTSRTMTDSQPTAPNYDDIEIAYRVFKKVIMHQAATGSIPLFQMDSLLQDANATKRCCRHLSKAQRRLLMVQEALQQNAEGEVTPSSVPEATNLAMLQEAKEKLEDKPAS